MPVTNAAFIESLFKALSEDEAAAGIHWNARELVQYENDGLVKIAEARPDAVTTTAAAHALTAGVRQGLPTGGFKLFEVLGNKTGNAVTLVDRRMLDASTPGWRIATGVQDILHCIFDPREPASWESYPPAASGATATVRYAAYPTAVTLPAASALPSAVSGNVPLPDLFVNALREYCLYRAKSKDADFAPGVVAASQQHLANCERALGAELNATTATAPRKALEG